LLKLILLNKLINLIKLNKFKILYYLQKNLSEEKFIHSKAVADTAKLLAKKYKIDFQKAYLAGLLHDIGKEVNVFLSDINQNKVEITNIYKNYRSIYHAFIGPYLIQKEFNICDKEILNAVKWHTTGKANMTMLEKIVFIADYIEPNRTNEFVNKIRKLAYSNLDYTVYIISTLTIMHLLKKNVFIFPKTIECKNYYLYILSRLNKSENVAKCQDF
jgi:predicted HD superfamily hydrolase involved in NAD metabolism